MVLPRMAAWIAMSLAVLLGGCGGGGGGGGATDTPGAPTPPVVAAPADISLLFMGNSHTSFHNLPTMVADLVRSARPGRTVSATEAPGWMFLEERAADAASLLLLRERPWSAVVLQAQKYSVSGQFSYSTEGAKSLVREARAAGALPILFPEWPQRGVNETQRIYDLHVSIAQAQPACVAPIGQAWDLASRRHPDLVLHASDGNHSAPAGAFLAAVVLAATFTQAAPDQFPFLPAAGVDADTQARLRQVAADTVQAVRPRRWCPADT